MPSSYETFFDNESFAVVGHSARRAFPALTYGALKKNGKRVFAIDPEAETIEGDPAYADFEALPEKVQAVVVEVPREETLDWVEKAAQAGISELWIHANTGSPEALALAREKGMAVRHGTCAVQYLDKGFPHNLHAFVRKLFRQY